VVSNNDKVLQKLKNVTAFSFEQASILLSLPHWSTIFNNAVHLFQGSIKLADEPLQMQEILELNL
jgi:hypothetical protein